MSFNRSAMFFSKMRELKACHAQVPRDTKAFVRRYANEIADEIVKEANHGEV